MKLYIDTSDHRQTIVRLGERQIDSGPQTAHSQVVIPMVGKLLKKQKATIQDITEIEVNRGPGSFTGLRVGVAIANALGYALKVPVNGKQVWKMDVEEPDYQF